MHTLIYSYHKTLEPTGLFLSFWINRTSMRSSSAMLWSLLSLRRSPLLTCSGWASPICLQRVGSPREKMTPNPSAQQVSMVPLVCRSHPYTHFTKPLWQKHNLSPHQMIIHQLGLGIATWKKIVFISPGSFFPACEPVLSRCTWYQSIRLYPPRISVAYDVCILNSLALSPASSRSSCSSYWRFSALTVME